MPLRFYFLVLLCALLWGSAFPTIKLSYRALALEGYGEQLIFAGLRFMLAGMLVAAVARHSVFGSLRAAPKANLLWVAMGQTVGQYVFFYYGLAVSSAALAALMVGAGSLWWVLLAPVFLGSPPPSRGQWLALGGCVVGITLAVAAPGAGSGDVVTGTIVFLLATLCGAMGAIGVKRVGPEFGSRATTAISLFFGGMVLLLAGLGQWEAFWADRSWGLLGVTVYLAMVSATAFAVWNSLIEKYSANVLSAYRFVIPLSGVLQSVALVEGETLGPGLLGGGAILVVSLYAMSRLERRSGREPEAPVVR